MSQQNHPSSLAGAAVPEPGRRNIRLSLQAACLLTVAAALYGILVAGPRGLLSPVEWVTVPAALAVCASAFLLLRILSLEGLLRLAKGLSIFFCVYLVVNTANALFLVEDGNAPFLYLIWFVPAYIFVYSICDKTLANAIAIPSSALTLTAVIVDTAGQGEAAFASMRTGGLIIAVLSQFVGILLLIGVSRFRERFATERAKATIAAERLAETQNLLQQLSVSEARYRNLVEHSLDVICVLDADGRFIDVGPRSRDVWGQQPADLIGRRLVEIVPVEDRPTVQRFLADVGASAEAVSLEFRISGSEGPVPMLWLGRWLKEEGAIYLAARDITDRLANEMRLRQSQKLEALGQLTGGIAHDFNNLLTVVVGNADAIEHGSDDPTMRPLAGLIRRAAERGADLTRRLLSFARRQPLVPLPVDVGALVQSTAGLLGRAFGDGIRIEVEVAATACWSVVDPAGLETAILNLALNARDAMPEGGRIILRIDRIAELPDLAAAQEGAGKGPYVVVQVVDEGEGMTPEVRERAFEPFFTTKPAGQGTGMGLSAVHGFTLQSGGDVRLESARGRGTVVTIFLPATAPPARAGESEDPGEVIERAPVGRILAVEDDPLLRESVAEQIVALGYAVDIVGDVPSALRKLEEGRSYDLVFSDVVMPGGMSGFDLAAELRRRWPALPVLLTTGYSDEERRAGGRLTAEFPILRKPYSLPVLAARLQEAIKG